MKVLHILLTGNIGGIEILCKNYEQYSKNENYYLFMWQLGDVAEEMQINNANVIFLNKKKKEFLSTIDDVLQICNKKNIDTVVVHHASVFSHIILMKIKCRYPHIKTIAYAHCNALNMCREDEKKGLFLRKLILKKSFFKADNVIAISESVKQSLLSVFNTPNEKISIIYNGVDIKSFGTKQRLSNNSVEIIYVGRLIKDKGVQVVLAGLSLLSDSVKYKLRIVGDGPYKTELENLTKQYNLLDKVEFLGNRRDVPKLLAQSDIFVHLPVCEEGFGITIVEAMAAGLICICSNSGAIPEIINDGKNGFLVKKENPKEFSQMIDTVIKNINTDNLKRIRTQAIEDSNIYSIEKFSMQLDRIVKT